MGEEKTFNLSTKVINVLMGIVALGLFVITKICFNFGADSEVLYGIMSIFVYCLSFAGFVWAYLRDKKPSFEMWFNVAVFVLALWLM